MMFVADRVPSAIGDIDDRLRSRFEGGLVLEVTGGKAVPVQLVEPATAEPSDSIFVPALADEREADSGGDRKPEAVPVEAASKKGGAWFPGPENAVIHWPRFEDLLIEELD